MALRGKRLGLIAAAGIAVALTFLAVPYVRTVAFLIDLSGHATALRAWIPIRSHSVTFDDRIVPTRHGDIPTRIYRPVTPVAQTIVVFPGVHGGGVDEPRLTRFCSQLASTGFRVVCTPLPELREFRITHTSTDQIEDVTTWAAGSPNLAPDGRVSLVGVSFSGALALVAAGRPSLAHRLDVVVSIGGYGSLARTLRYLVTGLLPDGTTRTPHDYGLAVVALDAAAGLVPTAQVHDFSAAVRTYLQASLDDSPGHTLGLALLADARRQADRLPDPARSIIKAVTDRDVATVGRYLQPVIGSLGLDPALSPTLSPITTAPVFLLHGHDDNVIPSSETPLLAEHLRRQGNDRVQWLLTPLVSHADVSEPTTLRDAWQLVAFWTDLRSVLDH